MEGSIVYQRSNGGESSCIILKTGTIVPILKPYKTEKHEIQKGRLVSIHPPRYISCEMADGTKQRIQWGQVFARVAYASLLESNRIQDPEEISSDCAHHPLQANRSGELQARRATIGLKGKRKLRSWSNMRTGWYQFLMTALEEVNLQCRNYRCAVQNAIKINGMESSTKKWLI